MDLGLFSIYFQFCLTSKAQWDGQWRNSRLFPVQYCGINPAGINPDNFWTKNCQIDPKFGQQKLGFMQLIPKKIHSDFPTLLVTIIPTPPLSALGPSGASCRILCSLPCQSFLRHPALRAPPVRPSNAFAGCCKVAFGSPWFPKVTQGYPRLP